MSAFDRNLNVLFSWRGSEVCLAYPLGMGKSKKRRTKTPDYHKWLLGLYDHVAVKRCSREAVLAYASETNQVSFSFPRNCSLRTYIEEVAKRASTPIPTNLLSTDLEKITLSRGGIVLGSAANNIDSIISRFGLQWWVDAKGLSIDYPVAEEEPTDFKWVAGKLTAERWADGRLPQPALVEVAIALDKRQFPLLENLLPAQHKLLGAYNKQHSSNHVRTFQQAVEHRHSIGRRAVRLTLCAARSKFLKLQKKV